MNNIRQARSEDAERIAEIVVFNYRLNFYPVFRDDNFYFEELRISNQMLRYAKDLDNIWVYDDGGDRWGAGAKARELAPEYGITYRTPLAPLCKAGHYGAFIGEKYADFREFANLLRNHRENGADFIKIMISGLMDFDRFGVLTEEGYGADEIRELIHIVHEEGMTVMAHANGARTVEAAAMAGVDSVDHGAYLDEDALAAMKENGTIWCPTLSTVGNLRGTGRFDECAVRKILDSARENVAKFADMGGILAPGTDAGAWAVPHGSLTEYELLEEILGDRTEEVLSRGIQAVKERF